MVARAMKENEVGDLSLRRVGDDFSKLQQLLIRLRLAKERKLRMIKSQIDEIGEEGVAVFSKIVDEHTFQWMKDISDQPVVSAISLIEAFEEEDMSNLINLIPVERGGTLKVEDMSPQQVEFYNE